MRSRPLFFVKFRALSHDNFIECCVPFIGEDEAREYAENLKISSVITGPVRLESFKPSQAIRGAFCQCAETIS